MFNRNKWCNRVITGLLTLTGIIILVPVADWAYRTRPEAQPNAIERLDITETQRLEPAKVEQFTFGPDTIVEDCPKHPGNWNATTHGIVGRECDECIAERRTRKGETSEQ